MTVVDRAVLALDPASAARVRPALAWLRGRGMDEVPGVEAVHAYLTQELPRHGDDLRERHETAWALGDLFAQAGRPDLAALCRSPVVHQVLAGWHWARSFAGVAGEFWAPALASLERRVEVPARATLSMSSARALLEAVGPGLELAEDGQLPLSTVLELDDRFRWTEEFPWLRRGDQTELPPLRLLREHLLAQRLLERDGRWLRRTPVGLACTGDTALLWRTVVDPAPRWHTEFERDALAVMAASVLRSADFTLGRIGEEMARVLAGKWRPTGAAGGPGNLYDGAAPLAQAWYQLGVPLGWWDTGNGPADRRPNRFGRAAAAAVFRAVVVPGQPVTAPGDAPRS